MQRTVISVNGSGLPTHCDQFRRRNWRATYDFTESQWDAITKACKRIANAFGYGRTWHAPILEGLAAVTNTMTDYSLSIAHPGRVIEGAARSLRGCSSVRGQRQWKIHAGIAAMPVAVPDTYGLMAVSCGASALLRFFALAHATDLELALRESGCPTVGVYGVAAQDALIRMMYGKGWLSRHADFTIYGRSRRLGMRTGTYSTLTRACEQRLRSRLLDDVTHFNRVSDVGKSTLHGVQRHKSRTETFWHPKRASNAPSNVKTFAGDLATYRLRTVPSQPRLQTASVDYANARSRAMNQRTDGIYSEQPETPLQKVSGDFFWEWSP